MQNNLNELIAIADKNDVCIGSHIRGVPLPAGCYVMIAAVLVFNSKGNIVLQRIASHKKWGGLLTYSAAGHVSAGETYEQAAIREMQEEIGITADLQGLIGVIPMYQEGKQTAFHHVFKVCSDGPYTLDPTEASELVEIPQKDILHYCKTHPTEFHLGALEVLKLL